MAVFWPYYAEWANMCYSLQFLTVLSVYNIVKLGKTANPLLLVEERYHGLSKADWISIQGGLTQRLCVFHRFCEVQVGTFFEWRDLVPATIILFLDHGI